MVTCMLKEVGFDSILKIGHTVAKPRSDEQKPAIRRRKVDETAT